MPEHKKDTVFFNSSILFRKARYDFGIHYAGLPILETLVYFNERYHPVPCALSVNLIIQCTPFADRFIYLSRINSSPETFISSLFSNKSSPIGAGRSYSFSFSRSHGVSLFGNPDTGLPVYRRKRKG